MAALASFAAPATLGAAGVLSLASLSRATWWTSAVRVEGIEHQASYTLWSRTATHTPDVYIMHGEECTLSDQCTPGTWCRSSKGRCWSDSDCEWHAKIAGKVDCSKLPRSATHSSWADLCGGHAEEGLPCASMHHVRGAVAACALLAAVACACALFSARSTAAIAGAGAAMMGGIGVALAGGTNLPGGHIAGAGFLCQLVATVLCAFGAAVAVRSVALGGDAGAPQPYLATTKYGAVPTEDEDAMESAGQPKRTGRTLLQSHTRAAEAPKSDLEAGKSPKRASH